MEAINGLREKFGGSIGYSNLSKKFYYYINLGFVFWKQEANGAQAPYF